MICKSNKNVGGKSSENYEEFPDLWKDADLGVPGLGYARRRLPGLKQNLLKLS